MQDEIRQLERDLDALSHKSSTLSESCQRDCNETEMFRRETQRVEADLREWKARDATVAASVVAIQDSGRLLAGMENEFLVPFFFKVPIFSTLGLRTRQGPTSEGQSYSQYYPLSMWEQCTGTNIGMKLK